MKIFTAALAITLLFATLTCAQGPVTEEGAPAAALPAAPNKEVEVAPQARDEEINARLRRILEATGWFDTPRVTVDQGVVFLNGVADSPDHRLWATELASRTEAVVAVVNRMELKRATAWDFQPVRDGLDQLQRDSLQTLPFVALALLILALSLLLTKFTISLSRFLMKTRVEIPLLREVLVYIIGFCVLLLGVYVVLRVSGLTRLALTVLGGTGLLGLVIGIAFRDITENFLASIFLSVQRPFRTGDFVEIAGFLGNVQAVTVRSTVMLTYDGILVQVPNSIVYKSTIRNFTSHPGRREELTFPVPQETPLEKLQASLLAVLRNNPSILKDPEPWVFVDQVTSGGIHMRMYYWIDSSRENGLRIRSSLLRHAQLELQRMKLGFAVEVHRIQRAAGLFDQDEPVRERNALYTHAEGNGESLAAQGAQRLAEVASPEQGANLIADHDGQEKK